MLRTPPGWTRYSNDTGDYRFHRYTEDGNQVWVVYYEADWKWMVYLPDGKNESFGTKRNRALAFASKAAKEMGGWKE